MTPQHRFSFTADLLYPAALGAGIAWWVEGFIGWMAYENPTSLALWTLAFGIFFIAYHARNFLVLRDEYGGATPLRVEKSLGYYSTTFARDVVDCIALVAAFMCLRLPGGKMRLADPAGVYAMAVLIPFGALITDARWRVKKSWIGRVIALITAAFGVGYALCFGGDRFEPTCIDAIILMSLLLMLCLYLFDPRIYGVRKQSEIRADPQFSGGNRTTRVVAVILLALGILLFAACRIRFDPSEEGPEDWIFVGNVHGFAISRPCFADPPLDEQMKHIDSLLVDMNPARIKLTGSGDTIPLTPVARNFVGNNAGLAHFRAECIQRLLVRTSHFVGVAFQTDGDAPSHPDEADPLDRSVIVWAVVKDTTMLSKSDRTKRKRFQARH